MKVRLGDYIRIKTGKLDANASNPNGKYPFFTCSIEPLRINTYAYDCECVLVAGNGDLNVKYYFGKFNAYQRTYIIESKDKNILTVPYLYCFLDNYLYVLRSQSIGGVIKYIKLANLTDIKMELPSVAEQNEIVKKVDRIKRIINLRKQQLEKLDLLIKSQFIEMFGTLQKNSYVSLEGLCKIITDGTHQPPKFSDEGIPFLFVSNLVDDEIDYETQKYISTETYSGLIKRTPIEIGDVLLSTVGSYGHPAVVTEGRKFCFQRHIAYLKPKSDLIDSRYLYGALLSPIGQEQIERGVKGIAQKTLNLSEIRKIKIPLPSLEQQRRYSVFFRQTDKSKLKITQSLKKLETLKKSLMQKYFE